MSKLLPVVTTAALVAIAVSAPADAAKPKPKPKPKPITKTYSMTLAPVPDPVQGTPSCARAELEGVSIHSETLTTTGAGTLTVGITGFYGDWDITVYDKDGLVGIGDGTSTPNTSTGTGNETFTASWKKGTTITVRSCNFGGSPQAKGSYTFTYK